MQRTTS